MLCKIQLKVELGGQGLKSERMGKHEGYTVQIYIRQVVCFSLWITTHKTLHTTPVY